MRKSASKPLTPIPRQKTLEPLTSGAVGRKTIPPGPDPKEIQNLIDNAVSRKSHNLRICRRNWSEFIDSVEGEFAGI